jgi:hypothetical protein
VRMESGNAADVVVPRPAAHTIARKSENRFIDISLSRLVAILIVPRNGVQADQLPTRAGRSQQDN